jgi:hypothetical protein
MTSPRHHHHRSLPPSRQGTVVLDIGDDIGALVVHVPARFAGRELSLARRGETAEFVHTEVRERQMPEGSVYAAVYIAVPHGEYTVLDAPAGVPSDVEITAGRVSQLHW